jgi:hypothetical protein
MDILGYSDLIVEAEKNNAQGPLLARLHSALAEGRTWLDNRATQEGEPIFWGPKDLYVLKAFTDNIVIEVVPLFETAG